MALVRRPHFEDLWAVKTSLPKPLLGWDLITIWKIGYEVRFLKLLHRHSKWETKAHRLEGLLLQHQHQAVPLTGR